MEMTKDIYMILHGCSLYITKSSLFLSTSTNLVQLHYLSDLSRLSAKKKKTLVTIVTPAQFLIPSLFFFFLSLPRASSQNLSWNQSTSFQINFAFRDYFNTSNMHFFVIFFASRLSTFPFLSYLEIAIRPRPTHGKN